MNKILITGAAGFIGVGAAVYFKDLGFQVIGIDNLSRKGSELNKNYLNDLNIKVYIENINNINFLKDLFIQNKFDLVLHLAGQVAVTTSLTNPSYDFQNNLIATFNLLECIRNFSPETSIIYSSTNKVYGDLNNLEIEEQDLRYVLKNNQYGINEDTNLNFHTPYGCSKGASEQYILDYSRSFGIKSVVFRQSCIYGERQMGVEDQGWVAWLSYAVMTERVIEVYGNGKQVRDLLYVEDLINAYYLAYKKINDISGIVFNIGGGNLNSLSIIEYINILANINSKKVNYKNYPKRIGDQNIFISDNRKLFNILGWYPKVHFSDGILKMKEWQEKNFELLKTQIF